MNLRDFISLVETKKDLFYCEISLNGSKEETKMLQDFCKLKSKKKRYYEAWHHIIYHIVEKFNSYDATDFMSEEVLDFLIENKIDLMTLGHLILKDEWLMKIYEKDNCCWEAKKTVELRKIKREN